MAVSIVPAPAQGLQWLVRRLGTNGAVPGTSGRALLAGWLIVCALAVTATVLNSVRLYVEHAPLARWEPWAIEGSSNLVLVFLAWIPGTMALRRPARCFGAGAEVGAHLVAALALCGLHVLGMYALREVVFAVAGVDYRTGSLLERFAYEATKDALTYAIFTAIFWLAGQRAASVSSVRAFDIHDGGGLIRTPTGEIVAAMSAGNYVEFVLADGRRPLMRTTLSAVEAALAPQGFVRTHRSWLVNPARLSRLRRQGSGDWVVALGDVEVPLSRRYRDALARLRAPAA